MQRRERKHKAERTVMIRHSISGIAIISRIDFDTVAGIAAGGASSRSSVDDTTVMAIVLRCCQQRNIDVTSCSQVCACQSDDEAADCGIRFDTLAGATRHKYINKQTYRYIQTLGKQAPEDVQNRNEQPTINTNHMNCSKTDRQTDINVRA